MPAAERYLWLRVQLGSFVARQEGASVGNLS